MPETNLEAYLEEYDGEYFEIYQNIKRAAQKIWENPRLNWYTGHGVEHSKRIIFHLNRLCKGLPRIPPDTGIPHYGLKPLEVFLLLAAARLHDIGMQDLSDLNNLPVDKMDENAWDEVRRRHPKRTYEIIMMHAAGSEKRNEFQLGIKPQPAIHAPLALICKGHGSDYFDEVVEIFGKRTFDIDGKGTKIRGRLLTALLLMADELDLHHSRAVFKENYPLSGVSKLHHFRHHYIEQVEVISGTHGIPETNRQVNIIYHFPGTPEENNPWRENLQRWVKEKIEKEAERTASFLHEGFDGHFSWAEPFVDVRIEEALENEKKDMEKAVQYLLAAEFRKVVDWKEITGTLKDHFKEKKGGVICLNGSREKGIERFISFVEFIFTFSSIVEHNHDCSKPLLAILNFSHFHIYHSIGDVLGKISKQLDITPAGEKTGSVADELKGGENFYMVILQHLDKADTPLIEEIIKTLVHRKENPGGFLLLITTDEIIPLFNRLNVYNLPAKYEEKDIYRYFIETGDTAAAAQYKTAECLKFIGQHDTSSPVTCMQIIESVDKLIKFAREKQE